MSGYNLVVVKSGKIAFSEYSIKSNGSHLKVNFSSMIDEKFNSLLISLSNEAIAGYLSDKIEKFPIGPYFVTIGADEFIEVLTNSNKGIEKITHKFGDNSYIARASDWSIESSATAGCVIYNEVGIIYEEAYLSCGFTPPPFYVGKISNISSALSVMPFIICQKAYKALTRKKLPDKIWDIKNKDKDYLYEQIAYLNKQPKLMEEAKAEVISLMNLERRNELLPQSFEII